MCAQDKELGNRCKSERVQGKRLLVAFLVFLLIGILSVLLASALLMAWVYFIYGVETVKNAWSNPELFNKHIYLTYFGGALTLVAILCGAWIWSRLFYRSGYITQDTQKGLSEGQWPVIAGYWKPVGYVVYVGILGYLAWLGYVQEGLWALVLMVAILLFYLRSAWNDFKSFMRNRRNGN